MHIYDFSTLLGWETEDCNSELNARKWHGTHYFYVYKMEKIGIKKYMKNVTSNVIYNKKIKVKI